MTLDVPAPGCGHVVRAPLGTHAGAPHNGRVVVVAHAEPAVRAVADHMAACTLAAPAR